MRSRIVAVMILAIAALVAAPALSAPAQASGSLYCSISKVQSEADALYARKNYLNNHRTHTAWNQYRPSTVSMLQSAGSCFRGAAASNWSNLTSEFNADAIHYNYLFGVVDLAHAVDALNSIVADYRAGRPCGYCT